MKSIQILMLFLLVYTSAKSQQKKTKIDQSIKANKNVVINLNTSYTTIEIDTWNKDVVEIQAIIESDELGKEAFEKVYNNWNINVGGSTDAITINSNDPGNTWEEGFSLGFNDASLDALKELEAHLADLPEAMAIPELIEGVLSGLTDLPDLLKHPKMPELPKLPELPKGISNVSFDYEEYEDRGEVYLEEWSKKYEKEYGKAYQEKMKNWAKEFDKVDFEAYEKEMEVWGEEFGKQFEENYGKDFEKRMEAWGEKFGEEFGEKMEIWGEAFGKQFEDEIAPKLEAWGESFGENYAKEQGKTKGKQGKHSEKKQAKSKALLEKLEQKNKHKRNKIFDFNSTQKVKKTIRIKMPKKAILNLDVRHGALKFVSTIHNAKATLSHTSLLANNIDGSETSINVSYSPVKITNWEQGELKLDFVENARINKVKQLVLNSNSSNININSLLDTSIINGSFGDLVINNLEESFNNLNIILENSEARINLPNNVDYNLYYNGNRSTFNTETVSNKTIKNNPKSTSNNDKTIIINANYSNIVAN